ncbi:YlxR family protein [Pseudonocardia sp.]|uniref:YlxR family protein n=1 Tax=Pseudonocardia sp. TaxID=60912 RepID=UPI0031FD7493
MGCRSRELATGLLRVVAVDGTLVPDPRRRLPGRGAWLHPVPECLDRAERRSAFPRALRVPGRLDTAPIRRFLQERAAGDDGTGSETARGVREAPGPVIHGSKVDPS